MKVPFEQSWNGSKSATKLRSKSGSCPFKVKMIFVEFICRLPTGVGEPS